MSRVTVSSSLFYAQKPTPFIIKDAARMSGLAATPHRHDYYAILWCFNAAGRQRIDCREYALEPHSLFFIAPGQVHQILSDPNPDGLLLLFTGEFLAGNPAEESFLDRLGLFDSATGSPPLMLASESVHSLMVHANGMMDAFQSRQPLRLEIIEAHLKLFLVECARQRVSGRPASAAPLPAENEAVRRFKRLLEEHYARWHRVGQYASRLHLSANYLGEIVRRALNQPPKEYILDRLLMEARRQLLFTSRSVKEIGFDLGFKDPSGFSRFFRDAAGLSVSEFRKTARRQRGF
jgi:AraC family transcriptional regulator, transcriptional activator of pobA